MKEKACRDVLIPSSLLVCLSLVFGCAEGLPSKGDHSYTGTYEVIKDETGLMAGLNLDDGGQDTFDVSWTADDKVVVSGSFILPTLAPDADGESSLSGTLDSGSFTATGKLSSKDIQGRPISANVAAEGNLEAGGKNIEMDLTAELNGQNKGTIILHFVGKKD